MGKTLAEKIWDDHIVRHKEGEPDLLFIDLHLIHEVTSPQAFDGLRLSNRTVHRPDLTLATEDHNVPTLDIDKPIADPVSKLQVDTLRKNCAEFGVRIHSLGDVEQGIVHVVGPQLGLTQPGMTIVCGDSHTSTHGAFGAIAFGIGTSEVEMVLASQCIMQPKPKSMRIHIEGEVGNGVTPKDVALYIISKLSTSGATGYFVEYTGPVFENMSMEGRMTVCNLSIEMGARGGMIAPDQSTFHYIKGREFAPKGADWDKAMDYWQTLYTDEGATYDKELILQGSDIEPMITYGTNPGMGVGISKNIPSASESKDSVDSYKKSLKYMGFNENEPLLGKKVDYVFLGSCTNGRIEDFRAFTNIIKGRKKADHITAWLVPGSHKVRQAIIDEGLYDILTEAGFELREPGCSACLAMNEDKIPAGKVAVSTSNRNFEGRQGPGARTMLASPTVAAATAVMGVVTDPRTLSN